MQRLIKIGFRKVGEWTLADSGIFPNLTDLANEKNVLYAFISDGEVLYVGQTTGLLKTRMDQYGRPGKRQNTNIKNNRLIHEALSSRKKIEIYAFADGGLHCVGDFHLNFAAGLEQGIVDLINPEWNEKTINMQRSK